jgi:GDP-4-dehydro-6-deoxy-D-mannose reductase
MRALITGVSGFAGSHLAENLLAHNVEVVGTCLKGESLKNIAAIKREIVVKPISLDEDGLLAALVGKYKPQWVFHLAAMASVGHSFAIPVRTMEVNLLGTMRLYEILRGQKQVEKIVFVSSADVFGPLPPGKMPIKSEYALQPVSPYGASKAAADIVSYQYARAFGLPIVRIRAFNHTGPRQATGYVIPDFCSQIVAIERTKKRGVIRVGDLSAKRDIADVRDIVDGYRLAAENGKVGEAYILASGKADSIENFLRMLIKHSSADISIRIDSKLLRPVEVPLLVGSIAAARRELGFAPQIKIEQTLIDTLEYWRKS